jgi:hypothetical protein
MAKLFPTLPLSPGEIPASYVCRLARLHGREPRIFCTDFGITMQAVMDGKPEVLSKIEELAGLPSGTLSVTAIHREDDCYRFRSEWLTKTSLRRERVYVCPVCIAEDIAAASGPPIVSAYSRAIWALASIRTCHLHNVALIECGQAEGTSRGDYSSAIGPVLGKIAKIAATALPRSPSSLETYILDRIFNGKGDAWVDNFDIPTLTKVCELIGALSMKGSDVTFLAMSADDWQLAGGAGYDIVSQGEPGIKTFISDLWRVYPKTKAPTQGVQAVLGILHSWLRAETDDQEIIRDIIYRHVAETLPVGPEDQVLGRAVPIRRLHSIYTASKEFGIHPKRLRKLLALSGAIPADHALRTDHANLFDAQKYAPLLARIATSMSLKEIETYLGADRVYAKLLHDRGFIKPFISTEEDGLGEYAFAKDDLDDFLARLLRGSAPVAEFKPPVYPIAEASKRANRSAAEVVAAILEGRLTWRGRLTTAAGFSSVLVNLDEVKRVLADPEPDAIAKTKVHLHLATSARVVLELINEGVLSVEQVRNPKNRCPMQAIPKIQVEQFKEKYISLYELSQKTETHPHKLTAKLDGLGIRPVFDKARISARFYLRSVISARL